MTKSNTKRICLWSGPRNISTALMYSFAQRKDTQVYDEPLYGHYLSRTKAKTYHPGADDILSSMENNGEKVIEMMMDGHDKPVVFFKNMTHHLLDIDHAFMKNVVNVMLTRDPVEMLPSFAKVIDNPTLDDVGYATHVKLIKELHKLNITPIVLDSKKILLNPKAVLQQLCDEIEIPFDPNMLTWETGARPEDGIWAKYWYGNIHRSKGFIKYQAKRTPFPENLKPLLESCLPHYKYLEKMAIG